MERLLKQHGQLQNSMPRVLELNPNHPIVKKLAKRAKADEASSDALLKDEAHFLSVSFLAPPLSAKLKKYV